MAIYVIKTPILERYEILYTMLSERLNTPVIITDNIKKESLDKDDLIWFHYFQEIPNKFTDNIIKPNNKIAKKWDSKFLQYQAFRDKLNIPEFKIFKSPLDIIKNLKLLKEKFGEFLITSEYGFSGYSFLFCDYKTTGEQIYKTLNKQKYRVSKYIKGSESFGIHMVIANKNLFFITPPTKQNIENITLFKGGRYPCKFSCDIENKIYDMCKVINNTLYSDGYVGLVHIDFLIKDNQVFFCEINPRTAGSTPYVAATLKIENGINLPYIEYYAIKNHRLPKIGQKRLRKIEWNYRIKFRPVPDEGMLIPYSKMIDILEMAEEKEYFLNFTDKKYVELKAGKI